MERQLKLQGNQALFMEVGLCGGGCVGKGAMWSAQAPPKQINNSSARGEGYRYLHRPWLKGKSAKKALLQILNAEVVNMLFV